MKRYFIHFCCFLIVLIFALPVCAQNPTVAEKANEHSPTMVEQGIPFTPRMAKAIAKSLVKQIFIQRYQLDPAKIDQASEKIAGRLMEFAHTIDTPDGQALVESVLTGIFEMRSNILTGSGGPRIPQELGQEIGQRLEPVMPKIREVFRNIAGDIQPELPIKQQLKLTGDLIMANSALDYMEATIQRWADGQISPYENPLDPYWGTIKYQQPQGNGESPRFKNAKKWAKEIANGEYLDWEDYIKQAKELYEFNESQCATADSVLRKCIEQANMILQDDTMQDRVYQNRLWCFFSSCYGHWSWDHPLLYLINTDYETVNQPLNEMEDELKRQIDKIPTASQRQTVEKRIMELMTEKGYKSENESEIQP